MMVARDSTPTFSVDNTSLNTIDDILDTTKTFLDDKRMSNDKRKHKRRKLDPSTDYEDFEYLAKISDPLRKLNRMIGMEVVKKQIIDQVLFFAQGLNNGENMHTVLTGPPGVGKTTLGKILSEIYCNLGFLTTDKFRVVTRSDFIAGYVGQTALKTKKLLDSALGGVLFIDEAYSLGDSRDDGYSKECLDTINHFLLEHNKNFVMIIAGYKEELNKYFFSYNKGLPRRFPWRYDINTYSDSELCKIFESQIDEDNWKIEKNVMSSPTLTRLFKENKQHFKDNGGDTQILFDLCKICHSRRVFGRKTRKKIINLKDIEIAFKKFVDQKKKINTDSQPPLSMYS